MLADENLMRTESKGLISETVPSGLLTGKVLMQRGVEPMNGPQKEEVACQIRMVESNMEYDTMFLPFSEKLMQEIAPVCPSKT